MTNETTTRRETYFKSFGKLDGKPLKLQGWHRASASDCSEPHQRLWWGDVSMTLNIDGMDPRQSLLIPNDYMLSKPTQWAQFCRMAVARGLMH